jgi:hypothetical protein
MNAALARLLHVEQAGRAAAREERHRREAAQVTFPDLAWDHFHWEQRRLTGACDRPAAAARYRDTRAAFETRHGEIIGEYWSITEPSGVALTCKKAPFLLRPLVDDRRRFHRSTDWVTRRAPALADVLFGCETLAIRITEVLRYTSESVALRRILAVASHLLGVIDRAGGRAEAAEVQRVASEQRRELEAIDDYYGRAGVRIGRTVYTQGMLIGLLLVAGVAAAFVLPLVFWNGVEWGPDLQALLVSFGAGAIGAFVSVLQRMAGEKFVVHYDLGKRTLYMLGSYRPVLGAVFGVFTYFLLASTLLETIPPSHEHALYYYGSLAFVAGFSERFTRVLVKGVEARSLPRDASAEH